MLLNALSAQQSINVIQGALRVLTALHLTAEHYPEQSCVNDHQSFDYIVVGAGTAGCVVASRLAEDKNTTVLLIEAGDNPEFESDLPALMLYLKASKASWNFTAQDPEAHEQSHKATPNDLSQGKVLGGTSSLSFLIYSTGSRHDYDNWARIVNDSIWNWDNVLPYFKKSQRLEDPILRETESEFFGENGKIGLTLLRSAGTISEDPYIRSFKEAGYNFVPSLNGNQSLGYTNAIYVISHGLRQNTALTYLGPKIPPNLHILKNTMVTRIIFDCNVAIGVEVCTCDDKYITLMAQKEVIISAGIVNTPKLLMLSGIGPKQHLEEHNINTISDLPVGEGLQNNLGVTLIYNITNLVQPYRPFNPHKYPATVLVGNVALNKSKDYPDSQQVHFINFPKNLLRYCTFTYYLKDFICNNTLSTSVNTQMMFTIIKKQRFKSRGKILLKSNNHKDNPLIYTNYYSVEEDLVDHARIIQDYVKIEKSETFQKIGGQFKDPMLPKCGKMKKNSLKYWKCYIPYLQTTQHEYSSTCAMGAVVDSRLRVYGIKRLRVVDASVMPNPTAGGTLGPTIMIGEKAADLIKEDRNTLD